MTTYPTQQVEKSVHKLLSKNWLTTIATVTPTGAPYSNTCFFSFMNIFQIIVLTPPNTVHAQNLQRNSECSLCIFDSHQKSGAMLHGVQSFGHSKELDQHTPEAKLAFENYTSRFSDLLQLARSSAELFSKVESRFFCIEIDHHKLLDELAFGKEVWVDLTRTERS